MKKLTQTFISYQNMDLVPYQLYRFIAKFGHNLGLGT